MPRRIVNSKPPPRTTFDWNAHTPHCTSCGTKTGALNYDDHCRTCAPPPQPTQEPPTEGKQGKPMPRSSAPRSSGRKPTQASSTTRTARDAGSSTTRTKNTPAARETRPTTAGRTSPTAKKRQPPPRPTTPRRPQLDENTITRAYLNGATAPALARQHGTTPRRIRRIVANHGIPLRDDRTTHSGGRNRVTFDAAALAHLRHLYVEEQQTLRGIADTLGRHPRVIARALTEAGVTIREPAHQRHTPLTPEALDQIVTAYLTGDTSPAIAKRHHLRATRVRQIVRDAGHTIRPRGGQASQRIAGRLTALGTTAAAVKQWAYDEGLIDHIPTACPPNTLIDAYAQAHPEGGESA